MAHPTAKLETKAARTAALNDELESIYLLNHSYWKGAAIHSAASNVDYDARQKRLKEILRELTRMKGGKPTAIAPPWR